MFYIYQYFDPIRKEPFYIGKGSNNRAWKHLSLSKNINKWYKRHARFYNRINWIRKQGQEPTVILIEKNLTKEKYDKLEIYWINKIGRKDFVKGPLLNHTDGGEGTLGHKHSKKSKEKNRQAHLNKKLSKQHKLNISLALAGDKHPFFGKHHKEKTKQKIGNANSKTYNIIFPDGTKKKITNLSLFCKKYNLAQSNLSKYGKTKNFKCKVVTCVR